MSKGYRDGAFALGLAVGGGITLNLFLWLDYRANNAIDASGDAEQGSQQSQIGTYWDGMLGTFVSPSDTLAQWVMAFFTIAATGVLILTLRSANKTNLAAVKAATAASEANQIMRDEQRPWLLPSGVHTAAANPRDVPGEAVGFAMSWRNFGKSPAARVQAHFRLQVIRAGGEIPRFDSSFSEGTGIVASGVDFTSQHHWIHGDDLKKFTGGQVDVIVFCRVDYAFLADASRPSFAEATYRCKCDGTETDRKTGSGDLRILKSLEGPQNTAI